jgi:hypothetical protein
MAARTRIRFAVALAALACVPAGATAGELVRLPLVRSGPADLSFAFGGLALVDSGPAWARRLPGGGWQVERRTADGSVRAVAASADVGDDHLLALVGAGQRLGWTDLGFDVLNAHDMAYHVLRNRAVVSGLGAGTSATIADDCPRRRSCGSDYAESQFGLALAPDAVVLLDTRPRPRPTITILPQGTRVAATGWPLEVQAAGSYLGWTDLAGLHVVDRRSGGEVLSVARVATGTWSLEADGRVAALRGASGASPATLVAWLVPGRTDAEPIASLPVDRHVYELRAAGGHVVVRDGPDQFSFYGPDTRLSVVEPGTGLRPLVRFPLGIGLGAAAWSFDGARLAWASSACETVTIGGRLVDAGAAPTVACARATPAKQALRPGPHGDFTLPLRCAPACRGTLRVLEHAVLTVPGARRVTVRLIGAARRRLARDGRLQAQVLALGAPATLVELRTAG